MIDFNELEKLFQIIVSRKDSDPHKSYTAKLFAAGRHKIAQKLGEESVELVIEAIENNKKDATKESADLLYHLLVLWVDMDIDPMKVMEELQSRNKKTGLEEKKSRKKLNKKDI